MQSEAQATLPQTTQVGHDFIRRKINQTRRSVKFAELMAGLMLFVAGSLLYLLTLALVDHWIVGLGFTARLVAFVLYLVGVATFLWVYVAPLLFHSINPLYAARIIEQGQPTLKNSLLNFLFLTKNQQGTRRAVLEAIETQAASDISRLKLDHLVDYTKAIRMGYVLAALAVLFGLYTVLSPKNPLQTAARVVMPWSDIARPSRVKIVEVDPGDTAIYQGEQLEVTAKIHDLGESDQVQLVYSTRDGQLVDQTIPLTPAEEGFLYTATISPSQSGIQQDLYYRIEAGDAVTRDFEVTAMEAPSIDVATVTYDYPDYTQDATVEQKGDGQIRALEGTQVTIRARANRPIEKAYLEFDPQDDTPRVSLNSLPMKVEGEDARTASVRFPLERNVAGTAGKYRSYQIRFRTEDGVLNPHPVLYPIDVIRDLEPEIEIVEPAASEVEVPANSTLPMRLRALDPDYAVRQIHIHGTRGGERVVEASLLDRPQTGQVIESWNFSPQQYQLQPGDVVELIGIAEDNKTDLRGQPQPNVAQSRKRVIRVIEPVQTKANTSGGQGDAADGSQGEAQPQQTPQQGNQGDQGSDAQEGQQGEMSDSPSEASEGTEGQEGAQGESGQQSGDGQGDTAQQGEQSGENQEPSGGSGSGDSSSEDPNQAPQQGEQSGSTDSGEPASPQQGQSQPGEGGSAQSQEQGGSEPSDSQATGGAGGDASQPSHGNRDGSTSPNRSDSPDGRGTGQPGDPNQEGQTQPGDASTRPNENSTAQRRDEPVASDGSQDGDAFERIQEYLKQKQQEGQQPQSAQPNGAEGQQGSPQDGHSQGESAERPQSGQDQQGDSSTGQGKQSGEPSGTRPDASDASAPAEDNQPGQSPMGAQNQGGQNGESAPTPGDQNGQQPMPADQPQVDNGIQPERSQAGQDATGDEQPQEGQPGSTDLNEGESIQRDTQNNEQGAGENKGGAVNKDTDANPSNESERSGDTGQGDNTDSGAGLQSNDGDSGSPQSSEMPNEQSKNDLPADQEKNDDQGDQAKSPSTSNKQSESRGGDRGDVSGGGKSGGGQSAKQAGNDSAGSTSAGDEGAGVANQEGEGETGQDGGDGPQADQQTGSSGNQQGEGSQQTASPEGREPGDSGSDPQSNQPNTPPPASDSQPQQSGQGAGNSAIPEGGGLEGDGSPQTWDGPRVEPGGDEANLEYAQEATDLVLDQLKHQQQSPDQELLNELGWSQEEFQRFVERWQKMKAAAQSNDAEAQQELSEALRSLGLSRGEDRLRKVESRQSTAGGSGDTQRSLPPPSFLEQYRAYLKGASQQ